MRRSEAYQNPLVDRDGLEGRDLTVRTVHLRADTLNEKTRSVEAVLATDQAVTVLDLKTWRIIDEILRMDGAVVPEQIPLLRDHQRHNTDALLGSWRGLRTELKDGMGLLVGRMFFVEDDADADRHWNKVRQKHLTDVSIGYQVKEYDEVEPGKTKLINGKEYTAQERTLRVATLWKPREGSLTPIGADESAKVREQTTGAPRREEGTVDDKVREYLVSLGLRADASEDAALAYLAGLEGDQAAEAARIQAEAATSADPDVTSQRSAPAQPAETPETPSVEPVDVEQVARAAVEQERARIIGLRQLAGEDVSKDTVQRAVDEGWDEGKASAEFLRDIREHRPTSVRVLDTQQEGMRQAVATAMVVRAGLEVKDEKAREAAEQFRGIGLQDIARLALQAEGKRVPLSPMELFERALSTISLPTILGTAIHRVLEGAYLETPSTLVVWTDEREVKDFRTVKALRLSEFSSFIKVGAGGQMEYASLEESEETYGADTYGRIITVTRRDFINDDLGAFLRIPGDMGRAARRNVDDLGYALLVSASGVGPTMGEDDLALFADHADGSNYDDDAAGALTSTSLGELKALLRVIKHGEGRPNTTAKYIMGPAALEQKILELVKSANIMIAKAGDADATTIIATANVHQGTVQPVIESRLDEGTDGATAWYLAADQKQVPTLIRVYLRGQRNPVVEKVALPANILGLGWRTYHDYGVGVVDWRGIVRSKGTA